MGHGRGGEEAAPAGLDWTGLNWAGMGWDGMGWTLSWTLDSARLDLTLALNPRELTGFIVCRQSFPAALRCSCVDDSERGGEPRVAHVCAGGSLYAVGANRLGGVQM